MKKTWKKDPGMSTTKERLVASIRAAVRFGPVYVEDVKALNSGGVHLPVDACRLCGRGIGKALKR